MDNFKQTNKRYKLNFRHGFCDIAKQKFILLDICLKASCRKFCNEQKAPAFHFDRPNNTCSIAMDRLHDNVYQRQIVN